MSKRKRGEGEMLGMQIYVGEKLVDVSVFLETRVADLSALLAEDMQLEPASFTFATEDGLPIPHGDLLARYETQRLVVTPTPTFTLLQQSSEESEPADPHEFLGECSPF